MQKVTEVLSQAVKMSDQLDEIEKQLEELEQKSEVCFQKCQIQTASRLAREATRLAKSHSLAIPYMRGLFDQMRFGHGLLDPRPTREASVQLVLLLEDEEQARKIQPGLDEGHYQWLCSWMSTCAYDNLAEATATMVGSNSAGMHECINDGLQICRQTGKLECIKCFREYAADVYLAADDFEMVRHQCQTFLEYKPDGGDNKDRRWSGHQKLGKLLLLEGNYEQAIIELQRAMQLAAAEDVYLKLRSRAFVAVVLDEALILAGRPRFDWPELDQELPEAGEWLAFEMQRALADALALVVDGRIADGIALLTEWDRRLTELNCRKDWFEVRLRLIAAYLLNDDRKRAESLAKGLEASADESQDFLTLRRLTRLLDPSISPTPHAAVSDSARTQSVASQIEDSVGHETDDTEEESMTPLGETLVAYMQQIMEVGDDDEQRLQLLEVFLDHDASSLEAPYDAAYLVHLVQFLVRGTDDAQRVWPWAESIANHFSEEPLVVSVVATLANYFRTADSENFSFITKERLESWFRFSTSPKVTHAKNFARAGAFFLDEEEFGEAERCYARAFRLDRKDSSIVLPLAELYQHSDRTRDALGVLDLSLREGNEDAPVAWDAMMCAVQLELFDAVLTYNDKFLELGEPEVWTFYYRALALFHLGRYEESLAALAEERQLELPGDYHLMILQICNEFALQRDEESRASLEELLGVPLSSLDYLTLTQVARLLELLWNSVRNHRSEDDAQRLQLELLMLSTGLQLDEYFEESRLQREETDVYHFHLQLLQPLGQDWSDSLGCLQGQEHWEDYIAEWGVLAADEEQAIELVMEYQDRCYNLPATLLNIQVSDEDFVDCPGVVWQAVHWSQGDQPEEVDDDDFDLDE